MGLLSRHAAPLSAALALVILAPGCFSELQGDSCINDLECFPNETCIVGACVERAVEVADVGMDVEEPDPNNNTNNNNSNNGAGLITGRVLDVVSGTGVPGQRVYTVPPSESLVTDVEGQFILRAQILRQSENDDFAVIVDSVRGYKQLTDVRINVNSNATSIGDIFVCLIDNACGGCDTLDGMPRDACTTPEGCVGFWECASDNESVVCGNAVCN